MSKNNFIAGIDLGTQNIKVLVASQIEGQEPEVVFQIQEEAVGIRRGVVISPDEISVILKDIFSRLKQEVGKEVDSVYVNVDGSHLFCSPSRGLISVSRADRKISEEDVQRVLQASQAISLASNKEIFDVVTREYIIDGEKGIKEPMGLEGVRLEAEVLALGGFTPYLANLSHAVLDSDLQISDMIPSPIAAARACLTKKQKELGVGLIDIGAGTTGLAVFEEGDLIHLAILPMGSANITNDIAIGLKTDIEIAEKIKIEYGSCLGKKLSKNEKIKIGEGESLSFSQRQLSGIIEARVSEILDEVNKELRRASKEKALPSGIVLTGGGAKMPGIEELAKRDLKLSVRIGKPLGVSGLNDPAFSTCCGLVLTGLDSETREGNFSFPGRGIGEKIKRIFRIFIP